MSYILVLTIFPKLQLPSMYELPQDGYKQVKCRDMMKNLHVDE